MRVARILVVQPSVIDPLGPLGEWLTEAGAELDVVLPVERELPGLDDYDAVVVLGGEMGAYDDQDHPWLAGIRSLLATAVAHNIPVLAICLGAQLLAAATGGRVRQITDGPEFGTLLVAKRDRAAEDPLFGPLPLTPDAVQAHFDEFTLPPSAELLASSPKCENQAFRVGDCAYGLQFHIETTPDLVREWAEQNPEFAERARPGHLDPATLAEFHRDLAETWRPFAENFVRLATTPPEDRKPSRFLPMA